MMYEQFLENLPPILTEIENKYDHDALTPLFRKHQENLKYFESKEYRSPKPRRGKAFVEQEKIQK